MRREGSGKKGVKMCERRSLVSLATRILDNFPCYVTHDRTWNQVTFLFEGNTHGVLSASFLLNNK